MGLILKSIVYCEAQCTSDVGNTARTNFTEIMYWLYNANKEEFMQNVFRPFFRKKVKIMGTIFIF